MSNSTLFIFMCVMMFLFLHEKRSKQAGLHGSKLEYWGSVRPAERVLRQQQRFKAWTKFVTTALVEDYELEAHLGMWTPYDSGHPDGVITNFSLSDFRILVWLTNSSGGKTISQGSNPEQPSTASPPPTPPEHCCGGHCGGCPEDLCCGKEGKCGHGEKFCGRGCQPGLGRCHPDTCPPDACGRTCGVCPVDFCCSSAGYCGQGKCTDSILFMHPQCLMFRGLQGPSSAAKGVSRALAHAAKAEVERDRTSAAGRAGAARGPCAARMAACAATPLCTAPTDASLAWGDAPSLAWGDAQGARGNVCAAESASCALRVAAMSAGMKQLLRCGLPSKFWNILHRFQKHLSFGGRQRQQ